MRNFDFYSPTYFVFGKDREAETGRYVKRFGGSRVLVVYGGQSAKRSGLLDRIMACLKEENLYAEELGGVKPNPRSGLVYEGIELCRREKIDFVLAVGGGSVIDTAKAIAIGVPYDGDFWDFFSGKMPEQALPVGTVLTIAASGSEGSPDSIITNEKTLEKNGAEADCLRPCFSVLDPALTESLPAYQTACGITDIMAHTFERYFTNTPDVEVGPDAGGRAAGHAPRGPPGHGGPSQLRGPGEHHVGRYGVPQRHHGRGPSAGLEQPPSGTRPLR